MDICMHACVYARICMHSCTHISQSLYAQIYMHDTHACICICTYVSAYVCM